MNRYPFAVRDQTYCVWDHDLHQRNETFLRSLDGQYFRYLIDVHVPKLEGETGQRAAVALRAGYHHSLETMFSLLGALTQAPTCVAGWLPKCSNRELRDLVADISEAKPVLTQLGRQGVSWDLLSKVVHARVWPDENPAGATAQRFAALWGRLANEFLDENHIHEYNSIKHGFRVSAGPFFIRVGIEHEEGVPPPESEMQTLSGGPHGIGFFKPESFPELGDGCRHHFRLRDTHLNWRIESVIQAIQLVSISINNVVGGLRILNGIQPSTVRFERPEDPAFFEAPWQWPVGLTHGSFEFVIEASEIKCASRSELLRELQKRRKERGLRTRRPP